MSLKGQPERELMSQCPGLFQALAPHQVIYITNISLRHRYIFVETPKVACSSIKLMLQRLELKDPKYGFIDYQNIHNRAYSPLLNPLNVGSFAERLADEHFFKFCFVRNPYTRLLSAYLDKVVRGEQQKQQILMQLGRPASALGQAIEFADFVRAVTEIPMQELDRHWNLQHLITMQDAIAYDFVGRFENFDEDMRQVFSQLGVDGSVYWHDRKLNATKSEDQLRDYYTPALADAVYQKFQRDFEAFSYPRELPGTRAA